MRGRGDPQREAKTWLEEPAKLERVRVGYHEQAAEGLMNLDELKEKLTALKERRVVCRVGATCIKWPKEELERLKRDRNAALNTAPPSPPKPSALWGRRCSSGYTGCLG